MRRKEHANLPLMEATVRLQALEQMSGLMRPRAQRWLRPMLRQMIRAGANLLPPW